MEELETQVADAQSLAAILEGLGLQPVIAYEKRRETWLLADCKVELDELPQLGWFVEIEGELESQIRWACNELGLSGATVRETYPALVAHNGRPDSKGLVSLCF